MKNRSELLSHFRASFCAEIHTQFLVYVQKLRSHNAKEYLSKQFQSFMLRNDIIRHLVLILLLKMELLNEKINTFLKPLELYCFKSTCLSTSMPMLFPPLVFLLIGCLPLSSIGPIRFKPSFPINLCFLLSLRYFGVLVLFEMFIRMSLNSILSH